METKHAHGVPRDKPLPAGAGRACAQAARRERLAPSATSSRASKRSAPAPLVSVPERLLIVLLKGGPFDGQDVVVSPREWDEGDVCRYKHRYLASASSMKDVRSAEGMRIFHWAEPGRTEFIGTALLPQRGETLRAVR